VCVVCVHVSLCLAVCRVHMTSSGWRREGSERGASSSAPITKNRHSATRVVYIEQSVILN